ncbi:hypothetical protein EVAR_11759_1 [Eumeta japonica]|uniref:Uncharacterized protein n=1 Tax=Eumeta variegata TaxID=151549 RepID=A0A4C1UQ09_EUMVA|nr:hypothetical protein EVAR_11759_1 [Eumeta japonica]
MAVRINRNMSRWVRARGRGAGECPLTQPVSPRREVPPGRAGAGERRQISPSQTLFSPGLFTPLLRLKIDARPLRGISRSPRGDYS